MTLNEFTEIINEVDARLSIPGKYTCLKIDAVCGSNIGKSEIRKLFEEFYQIGSLKFDGYCTYLGMLESFIVPNEVRKFYAAEEQEFRHFCLELFYTVVVDEGSYKKLRSICK